MSSCSCRAIRLTMRRLRVLGLLVYLFVTGRTSVAFFSPFFILFFIFNWATGKLPSRQTGGQSNPLKWLASRKIWSVEKLETLPAGTKPRTWHHWSQERGVERESARRSSMKGRERAIVNKTNTGTVSKATLGKLLRDGVERIWAFPSA